MSELTIIKLAIRCAPAVLVAVVLLDLLVDEYLRLMELAGLVRRRSMADENAKDDAEEAPRERD